MASATENLTPSCAYVVGDDGLSRWSDTHADAWVGLLESHRRLTRELDAELERMRAFLGAEHYTVGAIA